MGRERDILRWDIHTQLLTDHIASVEKALATRGESANAPTTERGVELVRELHTLQKRIAALGPSPRAKMG